MSELACALVRASEKAANIARSCRQEDALFGLLVEEKKEGEKNKKFVADFKTLADVLVQEVIKHDIGKEFPGLEGCIFGEESNEFTNGLGEKIQVKVCDTEQDTCLLLSKVLGGNMAAAAALARAAHRDVAVSNLDVGTVHLPQDRLGVWVDPIDSTFQYIRGISDSIADRNVYSQGLQCVTVLIGVYDLQTGEPLVGVVNQPFAALDPKTQKWNGKYYWGISSGSNNIASLQPSGERTTGADGSQQEALMSVVLSTGEAEGVKKALLQACEGRVHYAAGAGYKSLCVVLGLVDAYVFSEDTTFRWDCCGPHAILRSMGGGMADLKECLRLRRDGKPELRPELVYNAPVEGAAGADRWANKGGLVAYRSPAHLDAVLALLSTVAL
ncbi:inositol polyphosphate 1-phosphatase-like [Scleropages formosus]|uniref:Inositol polyphosphate 1-phosphatase n=1 Tax=Scleropages formosus TaxID=113540 RepID=A0A8C9V9H2_SCLFO|nr:inositol polyphosphate 1-phosphatase [Scleropages formosus]XP_018597092.2 inositol polyphosphate 1-phosphatase [Scleropages formosus]XP_018597102.2 inositol polyphosphate 1-phosphatase [Scleropages formosus]